MTIKRLVLIAGLLFCALPVHAQIAFVSSTEDITTGSTNPRTLVIDIGTRTNGGLIVCYSLQDVPGSPRTVSSATWNSVAMTKIAETTSTSGTERDLTTGILYLAGPTNGSQTLSVTLSGAGANTQVSLFPAWVDGMHQTSPLDDSGSNGTGTADPTIALDSTEANTLALAVFITEENDPLTSAQGTEYQNHDYGGQVTGAKYIAIATATSQTLSWTGLDNDNAISAANFKSVASATRQRYVGISGN